ncbi:MAG: ABC transporter ATP-binding protein [Bacteroidales bacterium]|nr:ABC transporter ATP-binding protein [Bacteroidales bacterium]
MRPYGARLALYGVFVVLSTAFVMATALSVTDFLKLLFEGEEVLPGSGSNLISRWLEGLYGWMIGYGKQSALWLFSLLVLALYGSKNLFGYLSAVVIGKVRSRVVRDIRRDLFGKSMKLKRGYFSEQKEGDILSRFGGDVTEYDENVLGALQTLVSSAVGLVMYLAMLLYLDYRLTGVVLASIPLVAFVISGLSRRLKKKSKSVQEKNGYLLSLTEEAISGLRIIKAYNAIDFSNRRFRAVNAVYSKERIGMFRRIYAASPISDFLGNTIVVAVLVVGAMMVVGGEGRLSAELFVSYIMLFVLMLPPAKNLSTVVAQIKRGKGCVARLEEFLSNDQEEPLGGSASLERMGDVEMRGVGFTYGEGKVLNNIDLSIKKGSMVALVGASGSGKTTLANILLRFYEPTEGSVMVDGRDVADYSVASWRSRIGVVTQEPALFNDSIFNNIAFGLEGVTPEQVEQAAKIANAHDFISEMEGGYGSIVGDGGSLLSGGQRQRICIARAIVGNPDLLVLDEATSALDTEAERCVQQGLEQAMKGRTVLVIAHRLSTVRNADEIVVLDKGEIVERGTAKELYEAGGIYRKMVDRGEGTL